MLSRLPDPQFLNYRIEFRGPVSQQLIHTVRLDRVDKPLAHWIRNALEKHLVGQSVSIYLEPDQQPASSKCQLCGQVITDGKPCGCGAR
jgi:hypothetical protein